MISFYFPPYDKVGGRRWAKHCKYFQKAGLRFRVLAGDFEGKSPWDKDLVSYNERITRVKVTRKYHPYHLRPLPSNLLEKIKWKLSLFNWERKKTRIKENYNDVSLGNENRFLEKAKELIAEKNVNTVLLSVGPFSYSRILPELKSKFPELKILLDFRDYWEDSFMGLTPEQVSSEEKLQAKVLNAVDLILSPNDEMQRYYQKQFRKSSLKLSHCFDTDDLKTLTNSEKKDGVIRILYGGAFYNDIDREINLVRTLTEKLNERQNTEVDFYVSLKGFENELNHPKIKRNGFISSADYFNAVKKSDYVILILPPNRVNAMSSKFFELVALRKPILYFGGKGEVSEFILANKLGFHVTEDNLDLLVGQILINLKNSTIPDKTYAIEKHSFEYQTKILIEQMQALLN